MKKKNFIIVLLVVGVLFVVWKGASFVYNKIELMNAPTMQELVEANPWTVPADWFKTDTITIKGRIEDYDADEFGFSSMACYFDDVFAKDNTVLVLDIADDGTFCKKFLASHPVRNSFIADESKVHFNAIRFFARPGETIDITVRKLMFDFYECVYNNGSSRDVERWLRTSHKLEKVMKPLWEFDGTFDEANAVADKVWWRWSAPLCPGRWQERRRTQCRSRQGRGAGTALTSLPFIFTKTVHIRRKWLLQAIFCFFLPSFVRGM
jgi:hypothetical protein